MDAHAIPQVSGGFTGVHLQWSGPRAWTYAPGGCFYDVTVRTSGAETLLTAALVDVRPLPPFTFACPPRAAALPGRPHRTLRRHG